jgi:hypothetical protein
VEKITATFYVYDPGDDPFGDAPLYTFPRPDHYGYRMKVDVTAP